MCLIPHVDLAVPTRALLARSRRPQSAAQSRDADADSDDAGGGGAGGKEEIVISSESIIDASSEAVCIDTAAFVGVTISFLMILIIALITIVFLWMRIKSMDRKSLL